MFRKMFVKALRWLLAKFEERCELPDYDVEEEASLGRS